MGFVDVPAMFFFGHRRVPMRSHCIIIVSYCISYLISDYIRLYFHTYTPWCPMISLWCPMIKLPLLATFWVTSPWTTQPRTRRCGWWPAQVTYLQRKLLSQKRRRSRSRGVRVMPVPTTTWEDVVAAANIQGKFIDNNRVTEYILDIFKVIHWNSYAVDISELQ